MNLQSIHRQFNCTAKQAGIMPTSWLAINSLSLDRTPEGYFSSGFLEGSGYA
jgi:hypothetical protein